MAGAIADADGRILVTRRADHVHQGGLWEFPGGKLEPGESPAQGLRRELSEELGIQIRSSRPLIRVSHDYGDLHVLLDVHRVDDYDGIPTGCEGQPLAWLTPEAMDPEQFPAADRPIINALRLPPVLLVTGEDPSRPDDFLGRLARAIMAGVMLVQLRAHSLTDDDYGRLAARAFALCERHRVRLLLNRDPRRACKLPRHGLHLTSRILMEVPARPGRPGELIGASCHDGAQLARAVELGLDYALLSPVKPTASHPDALPLGWRKFAELADSAQLPIYALGGLTLDDLGDAFEHGAQGIAGLRGLWPES